MNSRRNFIKLAGLALSLPNLAQSSSSKDLPLTDEFLPNDESIIKPPFLVAGDKVAITAPASHASVWEINNAVKFLKDNGLIPVIGSTIKTKSKTYYLSDWDTVRAEELNSFIEDTDIKGIIAARGGYGSMRILEMLNYKALQANPKIIIGFSDITSLLIAFTQKSNIVTFHGPVGVSSFNQFSSNALKQLIIGDAGNYKTVEVLFDKKNVISQGEVITRTTGGNLRMISCTMGTQYEIDTKDSILFLEDTSESPYQVDRMLTQLRLAGKFDSAKGIALGNFDSLDKRTNFFPGKSFTMREVFQNTLADLNIPVVCGLNFGHTKFNHTIPIGTLAHFNTEKTSISFPIPSCS